MRSCTADMPSVARCPARKIETTRAGTTSVAGTAAGCERARARASTVKKNKKKKKKKTKKIFCKKVFFFKIPISNHTHYYDHGSK